MLRKMMQIISLGERYMIATIFYMGAILILIGIMPKAELIIANEISDCAHIVMIEGTPTTVEGCGEGYICCGGICIDSDTCSCCDETPACDN